MAEATDSKTITITGTAATAVHDNGQESNKFDISDNSITGAELLGFKITPVGEDVTISSLVIDLTGIIGFSSGNFTNTKIFIDYGADGAIDGDDLQVGGAGVTSIGGLTGTITFSSSFTATTTRNYIFQADVASINPGDTLFFEVNTDGPTRVGVTSAASIPASGTISNVQHIRISYGGSPTGGSAPAGAGIVTGGTGSGGEPIGGEVGFITPAAVGAVSQWTGGGGADSGRVSDDTRAQETVDQEVQEYVTFGFSIPEGNTIEGIEVKLEANGGTSNTIGVALGIGTATSTTASTTVLTGSDVVYVLGGESDTWGRAWSPSEFNDGTFVLNLTAGVVSGVVNLDAVQVKVYHQASGGGSGGGGQVRKPSNRLFAAVSVAAESVLDWLGSIFFRKSKTLSRCRFYYIWNG